MHTYIAQLKNILSESYRANRWYRYLLFFVVAIYVWFVVFAPHVSILDALSQMDNMNRGSSAGSPQYHVSIPVRGYFFWLIFLSIAMMTIGIIIFNFNSTDTEEERKEIRNARGNLVGFFIMAVVQMAVWFVLLVVSVMSTDSCGTNCFPFDGLVSRFGEIFPVLVVVLFFGAFYAYLLRNFSAMRKTIRFGSIWLWPAALGPIVFLVSMFFFFSH